MSALLGNFNCKLQFQLISNITKLAAVEIPNFVPHKMGSSLSSWQPLVRLSSFQCLIKSNETVSLLFNQATAHIVDDMTRDLFNDQISTSHSHVFPARKSFFIRDCSSRSWYPRHCWRYFYPHHLSLKTFLFFFLHVVVTRETINWRHISFMRR